MDARRRMLAAIHVLKAQHGLDDDAYRDMLWAVARVRSAADLDGHGLAQVLDHLNGKPGSRPRPAAGKERMVAKVRALLAAANRPDAYADALARRICGVERFDWCEPQQLHKLVSALMYDRRRRAAQAATRT